jgi:hypothetical protein
MSSDEFEKLVITLFSERGYIVVPGNHDIGADFAIKSKDGTSTILVEVECTTPCLGGSSKEPGRRGFRRWCITGNPCGDFIIHASGIGVCSGTFRGAQNA